MRRYKAWYTNIENKSRTNGIIIDKRLLLLAGFTQCIETFWLFLSIKIFLMHIKRGLDMCLIFMVRPRTILNSVSGSVGVNTNFNTRKICLSVRWVTLWVRPPPCENMCVRSLGYIAGASPPPLWKYVCPLVGLHCDCVPPSCVSLHAAYSALRHFFIICQKCNEHLNCCTFMGRKYMILWTLSSPKIYLRTKSNVWLFRFYRKF